MSNDLVGDVIDVFEKIYYEIELDEDIQEGEAVITLGLTIEALNKIFEEKGHYRNYNEIIFPNEIYFEFNEEDIPIDVNNYYITKDKLTPNVKWASFSGHDKGTERVRKDKNGRYAICVGPKILNPRYPDNGSVQGDDFGDNKLEDYRIDVELKHVDTGDILKIECVVWDLKAHTYNYHLTTKKMDYIRITLSLMRN